MRRSVGLSKGRRSFLDFFPDEKHLALRRLAPFDSPSAWVFDPLGPTGAHFYRIHPESQPDHYLHLQTEEIACEPVPLGWNSAYWWLDPVDKHDTFVIRNFWRQGYVLYQDGDRLKAGPLTGREDDPSIHWRIEPISHDRLLVPIHLDAIWLAEEQAVVDAMADFSRLPHFNGERDVHPNTPHISEVVLNPPLAPPQLYLKPGIHLHWALPDALHTGLQEEIDLHIPLVPDRWLVTKRTNEASSSWVIESNYLYPPDDPAGRNAIPYPFSDGKTPHPYRHMGRKTPLAKWRESDLDGQHPDFLHTLTAIGYGEPNFAAFYPNCYSLFGFHDEQSEGETLESLRNITYEVVGWHSGRDVLHDKRLEAAIDALLVDRPDVDRLSILPYKFAALEDEYRWTLERDATTPYPVGALYFARLTIAANATGERQGRPERAKIVLGNTATEALATHLGREIGEDQNLDPKLLEDQLEALVLMPEVEGKLDDPTAQFNEARHAQGFKGLHGGTITTLVADTDPSGQAQSQDAPHHLEPNLPPELAAQLDALNRLERRAFEGLARRQSLREQLFSDWHRYMQAAYPPPDSFDDYYDIDEIAYFIENYSLKMVTDQSRLLDGEIGQNNGMLKEVDDARSAMASSILSLQQLYPSDILDWQRFIDLLAGDAPPKDPTFAPLLRWLTSQLAPAVQQLLRPERRSGPFSEADKVTLLLNIRDVILALPTNALDPDMLARLSSEAQLLSDRLDQLTPFERLRLGRLLLEAALPETLARRAKYRLEALPEPRFWQAYDPVVLIADADLGLTKRHGEDGRMREDGLLGCSRVTFAMPLDGDETELMKAIIDTVKKAIDRIEQETTDGQLGFYTWRRPPWHPFMLEWSAEFFHDFEKSSHAEPEHGYRPDYISNHYSFPEDRVDLIPNETVQPLSRTGSIYAGRTIMLDYSQPLLVDRLEAYCTKYLAPQYYEDRGIPASERPDKTPLADVAAWAANNRDRLSPFDQAVVAIQAHLATNRTPPTAQILSGFHAALLQHKETLQLPIADPIGFPDGKRLAASVQKAVDDAVLRAPQPEDPFIPLRTGALRLLQLHIVDTFGQVQPLFAAQPDRLVQGSQPFKQLDPPHLTDAPPIDPASPPYCKLALGPKRDRRFAPRNGQQRPSSDIPHLRLVLTQLLRQ